MLMLRLGIACALLVIGIIYLADTGHLGFLYSLYDFPYGDKVGHITLLGLVTFPTTLGLLRLMPGDPRRIATTTAAVIALLISLEEASQAFFPTRTLDPLDLLASYIGIASAAWLAYQLHTRTATQPARAA